jgi:DNA replication protein DnaC
MNITEWNESWQRIKERFQQWQPTATEAEDWCMGLRIYNFKMVESVGQWISITYSSKEPKLAWYIRECEKRKRVEKQRLLEIVKPNFEDERANYNREKEKVILKLEATPIKELRTACISVLKKYGNLISKPENGKPREWKPTLRSLVHIEIYGGKGE